MNQCWKLATVNQPIASYLVNEFSIMSFWLNRPDHQQN